MPDNLEFWLLLDLIGIDNLKKGRSPAVDELCYINLLLTQHTELIWPKKLPAIKAL